VRIVCKIPTLALVLAI
jgi:hypothetical protein